MGLSVLNKKSLLVTLAIIAGVVIVVAISGYISPLQSHVRQGGKAEASGDLDLALKEYNLALEASPENREIRAKIAGVFLLQENFKEADDIFFRLSREDKAWSEKLNPLWAKAKLGMAKEMRKTQADGSESARIYLQDARRLDSENQEIQKLLAEELYFLALKIEAGKSFATFQEAIGLDPDPRYKLALLERYLWQEHPEDFDVTAKSFTPEDLSRPEIKGTLARLIVERGKRLSQNENRQYLTEWLTKIPDSPLLLLWNMKLMYLSGERDKMEKLIQTEGISPWQQELLSNYFRVLTGTGFVTERKAYTVNAKPWGEFQVFNTVDGPLVAWVEMVGPNKPSIKGMYLRTGKIQEFLRVNGELYNYGIGYNREIVYAVMQGQSTNQMGTAVLKLSNSRGTKVLDKGVYPGPVYFLQRVSPDGRYMVYSKPTGMAILELATGKEVQISDGVSISFNSWAPDGGRLLLQSFKQADSPLQPPVITNIITNTKGEELKKFESSPADQIVGWESAGKLIMAKQANRYGYGLVQVEFQAMDVDTQKSSPLFSDEVRELFGYIPTWSPQGRYMLFSGISGLGDMWVYPKAGVPFPIEGQGRFVGWADSNTMVFSDPFVSENADPWAGPRGTYKVKNLYAVELKN